MGDYTGTAMGVSDYSSCVCGCMGSRFGFYRSLYTMAATPVHASKQHKQVFGLGLGFWVGFSKQNFPGDLCSPAFGMQRGLGWHWGPEFRDYDKRHVPSSIIRRPTQTLNASKFEALEGGLGAVH